MTDTAMTTTPSGVPTSDVDLQDDAFLVDPFPTFASLREAGPVVWLERYGYFAVPRYAEVSAVLSDWDTYTSTEGVSFNEHFNGLKDSALHSHGELHDEIRQVQGCPIKKGPLAELQPRLRSFAEDLVTGLRGRTVVDGVRDIAMPMPLEIVTDLVGLQDMSWERLFDLGIAGFDAMGPVEAPRTMPALQQMMGWAEYSQEYFPDKCKAGGWADQLFHKGAEAGWSTEFTRGVLADYIFPSVDTTISAVSTGLKLFAENPDQWDRLRADRGLLASAIPEIVRLASPLLFFTRYVTTDTELSGVQIPAGSRVVVMYSSANRDQSTFPDADAFDITRNPTLHVGWGRGKHACFGKPLARLEMTTLFDVLADHVSRFQLGAHEYRPNNVVRSLESMELTLEWDASTAEVATSGRTAR
jgi:cytochrome P450